MSVAEPVEVPAGRYRNALLTKDTSTIEPIVAEHKFYAPDVGLVLTLQISGDAGRDGLIKLDQGGTQRRHRPARTSQQLSRVNAPRPVEC